MKVEPTPTSPKAKLKQKKDELEALYQGSHSTLQPPARKSLHWWTLVFAIVFGFFAGVLGNLALSTFIGLYEPQPSQTIITQRPTSLTELRTSFEHVHRTLLGLYPQHATTENVADGVYSEHELIGSAVLVSSDGWAVTTALSVSQAQDVVAVTYNKKVLALENAFQDPATGLVFFHIDGGNYPIASFAHVADFPVPVAYYVVAPFAHDILQSIRSIGVEHIARLPQGSLESSELIEQRVALSAALPASNVGSPVVDSEGRVVALVASVDDATTYALSADIVQSILSGALRNQGITRPLLGVHYLDLARVPGIPEIVTGGRTQGALLAGTEAQPALTDGSPAASAGLREGDIVLSVDERDVDTTTSLTDLIQNHEAEDTITCHVVREGQELDIRVTLGTLLGE